MAAYTDYTELVADGPALQAAGLVHRVRRPDGGGPHPTIVMLHGRHGDEDAMWLLSPALPPDWLVVAPRAPLSDPYGGYDWRPRRPDEWPTLRDFDDSVTAVVHLIGALPDLYDADPRAMYLMGFSQGAATAYATALAEPELIRGIAGIVGFVPTRCEELAAVKPMEGLPVFMAVGRRDPLIPLPVTQSCARTLSEVGADLSYKEYDVGHKLSSQGMRDLRAWWSARPEARRATDEP